MKSVAFIDLRRLLFVNPFYYRPARTIILTTYLPRSLLQSLAFQELLDIRYVGMSRPCFLPSFVHSLPLPRSRRRFGACSCHRCATLSSKSLQKERRCWRLAINWNTKFNRRYTWRNLVSQNSTNDLHAPIAGNDRTRRPSLTIKGLFTCCISALLLWPAGGLTGKHGGACVANSDRRFGWNVRVNVPSWLVTASKWRSASGRSIR